MDLVYLRRPYFIDNAGVRFAGRHADALTPGVRGALESIMEGAKPLESVASAIAKGQGGDPSSVREQIRAQASDPRSAVGILPLELDNKYEIVVLDQGYGGVYVHTVELIKQLRKNWSCLLLCPEAPLFDDALDVDMVTLNSLRQSDSSFSYLSYVHVVRGLLRILERRLLLITHRTQSIIAFDIVRDGPTVIYCDGYFDGTLARAQHFKIEDSERVRLDTLKEIYFLLGNGPPSYYGITAAPDINPFVLNAGCIAVRDAKVNWCWGRDQVANFKRGFPELQEKIKFVPPFCSSSIFEPSSVNRERRVMFTTTMHNIHRKGFPQLMNAMARIEDLHAICVVRQPKFLPEIPEELKDRIELMSLPKPRMIELYHRAWMNFRVSEEESSPLSILESMTCEVPQVTSTIVAGQLPILEDGKTGFILDPRDEAGISRAVRTLLTDRELRDRMGRECRARAAEYSTERRIGLFHELLP